MAKRRPRKLPPKRPRRYIVVMFQTRHDADPIAGTISRLVHARIKKLLDRKITTVPAETELDIWIDSPGGDAHTAYKMFLHWRSRCARLRMVIPEYAKSAATLLATGMDEIYMSPDAELGPLDVQIEHPDRENVRVSGLSVARAASFICQQALGIVLFGGQDVLRATELSRSDVLSRMCDFSSDLHEPLLAKLDPTLVHKAASLLDVAKEYSIRMLDSRAEDVTQAMPTNSAEIAERLVGEYPAHEFVISPDEASQLGLPIKPMAEYTWKRIAQGLHEQYHMHAVGDGFGVFLHVFSEDELLKRGQERDDLPENQLDEDNRESDPASEGGTEQEGVD